MSVQASAWVWERSRSKGSARLVALAIADHARADGTGAWPSVGTLADKTRLSERAIRYLVRELEEYGEVVVGYKKGPFGCNTYDLVKVQPWLETRQSLPGETVSESKPSRQKTRQTRQSSAGTRQRVSAEPSIEPSVEPISSNGSRRRERSVIKNALVEAARWSPDNMTSRAWGRVEEAAKDLHSLRSPPSAEDILGFAIFWEQRWNEWPTPQTVSGNWADYKAGKLFVDRSRRGVRR